MVSIGGRPGWHSRLLCAIPAWASWLILDGGTAVGFVVLGFGYSLECLGRNAFVDEFYLREEYRGRGGGRQTMAFLEDAARLEGIRSLHLEVVQENTSALQFAPRAGFRRTLQHIPLTRIAQDVSKPVGRTGH